MGLAFQIQDDFLDTFGERIDRASGGDILSDKKTLLWLTTLADEAGEQVLSVEGKSPASGTEQEAKIAAIRSAMLAAGADREAQDRCRPMWPKRRPWMRSATEDAAEWFGARPPWCRGATDSDRIPWGSPGGLIFADA